MKVKICTNSIEIEQRNVRRGNRIYSQSRSIERDLSGKLVKDSGWKDFGGYMSCPIEVPDAIWWNPKTWGRKKTIEAQLPDYILAMAKVE